MDERCRACEEPAPSRLLLHKHLQKAESSLLVQARTGCIGLAHFLRRRRVPRALAEECRCREGAETLKQIAIHYEFEDDRRHLLSVGGTPV
jgi:hypothetical protein